MRPATAVYEVLQAPAIPCTGDQCLQDVLQPAIKELEENIKTPTDHLRNDFQLLLKQSFVPHFFKYPPKENIKCN